MFIRYTTRKGRGAWDEGRDCLPQELADAVVQAKAWCPKTPRFGTGSYLTYFTPAGDRQYCAGLKDLHESYLGPLRREVLSLLPGEIIYQDEFQVLVKVAE